MQRVNVYSVSVGMREGKCKSALKRKYVGKREREREVDCACCMKKRERVEDARKRGLKLP